MIVDVTVRPPRLAYMASVSDSSPNPSDRSTIALSSTERSRVPITAYDTKRRTLAGTTCSIEPRAARTAQVMIQAATP